MNEREIFLAAKSISDAVQRTGFLQGVCGDDVLRLKRIESLLTAAEQVDGFLQLPDTGTVNPHDRIASVGMSIGPYKLIEQIGEGGFAIVFKAEQSQPLRRTIALKIIKPGMDSRQVIARFEMERQALAIMDHPNIAKVFDAGTTETGRPYFAMELVKGTPITEFCDRQKLPLQHRLELFVSVCHAIQHAHVKGVIHRDIKPGNVLVAMYDNLPVPKVIDFGIAIMTGQQLTENTLHTAYGAVVGSIEYMSPEQASFNQLDVDTWSDVYSPGILLYELLTGSPPIPLAELRHHGLLESLRMIRETEPLRPSHRLSTADGLPGLAASRAIDPGRLKSIVKGDLDWIVLKALDKDRNRRYETVNGLAAEIDRYLRGDAVLAHPPSRFYQIRKIAIRNWRSLVSATLLLLFASIVAVLAIANSRENSRRLVNHSSLVNTAIDDASRDLGTAMGTPVGRESEWVTVRTSTMRLKELLSMQPADNATHVRAAGFPGNFQQVDADRKLAEQIENVVIMSATHEDLESWQKMAIQFRELFDGHGIDLESLSSDEIARRIRDHHSADKLADALEL